MKFRTEIKEFSLPFKVHLKDSLFFMGSCFAENMSERFSNLKFQVDSNPFGTLYNPLSISTALQHILSKVKYTNKDIVEHKGVYYSWFHHGHVSELTANELLKRTNLLNKEYFEKLKSKQFLFITLGSAWGYRLKESNLFVANCHKQTSNKFTKELIDFTQITEHFEQTLSQLLKINPKIEIVFTISPVRHIRDGLIENNKSKAELIKAVHQLCDEHSYCHYLPVYEWVIDDLRDYRFFEKDLVHPNNLATDYLWEKISSTLFSSETNANLKDLEGFLNGVSHRPFHAETKQHQTFLQKLYETGLELEKNIGINLQSEISALKQQITKEI